MLSPTGGTLRITGQLIDATTGAHLWADRYDGSIEDIFDLQDSVTSSVVGAIAPKLESAEIERAKHKPTSSLDAYDYYLRGMAAFYQWADEDNAEALNYFYRAIELDPEFAIAHGMAARCFSQRAVIQPLTAGAEEIAEAERLARRAADLGRNDAMALCMAGVTRAFVVGLWLARSRPNWSPQKSSGPSTNRPAALMPTTTTCAEWRRSISGQTKTMQRH